MLIIVYNISSYDTVAQHHVFLVASRYLSLRYKTNMDTHLPTHLNADFPFILKITFVTHQQSCVDLLIK